MKEILSLHPLASKNSLIRQSGPKILIIHTKAIRSLSFWQSGRKFVKNGNMNRGMRSIYSHHRNVLPKKEDPAEILPG